MSSERRWPLFSDTHQQGKRQKMKPVFHHNMRKSFFTVRVTQNWKKLPKEVVEFPSLKIFKTPACFPAQPTVRNLLCQGSWTVWSPDVSSNAYNFVILWFVTDFVTFISPSRGILARNITLLNSCACSKRESSLSSSIKGRSLMSNITSILIIQTTVLWNSIVFQETDENSCKLHKWPRSKQSFCLSFCLLFCPAFFI